MSVVAAAAFAARHLLVIPLAAGIAYVPGRRLLRRVRFDSWAEELAVCAGMGIGLFGSGVFLLGLIG
jgi:hypothetical protein